MTNSAPVPLPLHPLKKALLAPFYSIRVRIHPWAGTPHPPLESGGEVLVVALAALLACRFPLPTNYPKGL